MMRRSWWRWLKQGACALSVLVVIVPPASLLAASDDGNALKGWAYDPTLTEQWKESPTVLPEPPPATSRLLAVPMGPTDTLKLYVDPPSLSRLKDGVARLTLVVVSPGGARNVFHDGFRCETKESKTYAIGKPDGTWMPVKDPEWQKVPFYPSNAFRDTLMRHYLCSRQGGARKPDEILREIRFPSPSTD